MEESPLYVGSAPSTGSHSVLSPSMPRRPSVSTTDNLSPVRPEARRAYGEDGATTTATATSGGRPSATGEPLSDQSSVLLQQAANYASLATLTAATKPTSPPRGVDPAKDSGPAAVNVPKRRLTRNYRLSRSKVAQSTVANNEDDVESYDAPRLSISSAESSGGSEVKTPDSTTVPPSWEKGQVGKEEVRTALDDDRANEVQHYPSHVSLQQETLATPTSPSLFDFATGLLDAGFDSALSSTRRQRNPRLMEAALDMGQEQGDARFANPPDEDGREMGSQSRTSSGLTAQSRASTIRAKRPTTLVRLPSARTDDTAHPSPPASSSVPSTAGPTPAATADNAFGKGRDPMESAEVTAAGHGQLSSFFRQGSDDGYDAAIDVGMPAVINSFGSHSDDEEAHDHGSSSGSRELIASPDSWRSLLPEHDPFFISSETLSSGNSSRAASLAGIPNLSQRLSYQSQADSSAGAPQEATSEVHSVGPLYSHSTSTALYDREKRRLSAESMQSSFSLPGPTAASTCASSIASASLYDLDGTFNSCGSRAAFAPLQYHYNHSSRSLASPLLYSAQYDSDPARPLASDDRQDSRFNSNGSASSALQAASRRHASFSTFDSPSNSQEYMSRSAGKASQSHQPQSTQPNYHDRSRAVSQRIQHPLTASVLSSSPERRVVGASTTGKGSVPQANVPSSPGSSCAMGNEGDRQSWPSSRNSMQGWQAGTAGASRNSVQAFDLQSVDQRLAEGLKGAALHGDGSGAGASVLVARPPDVLSTNTSTVESIPADVGGPENQPRLLTTMTTTTLTTVTTTLVSSPGNTPAPLISPTGDSATRHQTPSPVPASPQPSASKSQRVVGNVGTPYDVSPLSPSSLPFLDSRPAPPSTDFHIETHTTHYTLKTKLPGFGIDGITLATKHHRQLVIVADKWDENNGGHFERRVTFGDDADLRSTRANFDGTLLKITVPRRA